MLERLRSHLATLTSTQRRAGLAAVAVFTLAAVFLALRGWGSASVLPTPEVSVHGLQAKALYYNGPARPWLVESRRDLLSPEDTGVNSEKARAYAQAALNPKLFRQLDRQQRFDALLFVGDPSQYRPLLEHLLDAQDWALESVDHNAIVFRRGTPGKWQNDELEKTRERLKITGRKDMAQYYALAATKLVALREGAGAKQLLDKAEALDSGSAEVWTAVAQYRLSRGEWAGAIAAADKATAISKEALGAIGTKVQALYATKRFTEAYALSSRIVAKLPDDPNILFYHAKAAHEAHAFGEEIRVLERLIKMAEENGRPTAGYRVYLGQAYAKDGESEKALQVFARAMEDPDISREQAEYARECVRTISERLGRK